MVPAELKKKKERKEMNERHAMLPGDYFLGYQKFGLREKNGNNKYFSFTFLVKTISLIGLLIFSLN